MKFLQAACLFLSFTGQLAAPVAALEGVLLGQLEMQMGSRSTTNPNQFLVQVISETQDFLNDAFAAIYYETGYEFSHTSLSVTSYSIDNVGVTAPTDNKNNDKNNINNNSGSGYIASIDLAGTVFFEDAPPQEQVSTVISAVFQQQNQLFLQELIQSTDPFLQDINYAIVKVKTVGRIVNGNGNGNSPSPLAGQEENNVPEESAGLESWMLAVIVGAGTFVIVFCLCIVFLCFTPLASVPDIETSGSGKQIHQITTKDTAHDDEEDGVEFYEDHQQQQQRGTHQRRRSLSPVRSITSQDSSRFTYNPKSTRSSSTAGGGFLNDAADTIDIEAWQQGSTINRSMNAFGHDISAIESKKDLSLIEEGDFEDVTPHKTDMVVLGVKSKQQKPNYLSQHAVSELDRAEHRREQRSAKSSQQPRGVRRSSNSSKAHDVIADLNDLSYQIEQYRGN